MIPTSNYNGIAVAKHVADIKRQLLAVTDSPSSLELVTITINTQTRYPAFSEIKAAIELLNNIVENDIKIEMFYSDYDCTGQSFTSGIDCIKRFTVDTGDETLLIAIYEHWVSVDC